MHMSHVNMYMCAPHPHVLGPGSNIGISSIGISIPTLLVSIAFASVVSTADTHPDQGGLRLSWLGTAALVIMGVTTVLCLALGLQQCRVARFLELDILDDGRNLTRVAQAVADREATKARERAAELARQETARKEASARRAAAAAKKAIEANWRRKVGDADGDGKPAAAAARWPRLSPASWTPRQWGRCAVTPLSAIRRLRSPNNHRQPSRTARAPPEALSAMEAAEAAKAHAEAAAAKEASARHAAEAAKAVEGAVEGWLARRQQVGGTRRQQVRGGGLADVSEA